MKDETFTEIYERYGKVIKKSVMAQTGKIELAEDICQQTFETYYRKIETVEAGSELSWLFVVAEHELIDYWRKASTNREIFQPEAFEDTLDAEELSDPAKVVTDRILACDLMRALRKRNRRWYDVVYHIYFLRESYEEAARHLGVSAEVLRARCSRALRFLRKKFGKDYLDE